MNPKAGISHSPDLYDGDSRVGTASGRRSDRHHFSSAIVNTDQVLKRASTRQMNKWSFFLITSSLLLNTSAQAQDTVVVPFSGTVPATCSFTNVIQGTLEPFIPQSAITGLRATLAEGIPASVDMICTSNVQLEVGDLEPVNENATDLFNQQSPRFSIEVDRDETGEVLASNNNGGMESSGTVAAGLPVTLRVSLELLVDDPLAAGEFVFQTQLTAIPE